MSKKLKPLSVALGLLCASSVATAQTTDRPQTEQQVARRQITQAEQRKDLSALYSGYLKLWALEYQITGDVPQDLYPTLDKFASLRWLSAEDKQILSLLRILVYERYRTPHYGRAKQLDQQLDPLHPEGWSGVQYDAYYTSLIKPLIGSPLLTKPLGRYLSPVKELVEAKSEDSFGTILLRFLGSEDRYQIQSEAMKKLGKELRASLRGQPVDRYTASLLDWQELTEGRLTTAELRSFVDKYGRESFFAEYVDDIPRYLDGGQLAKAIAYEHLLTVATQLPSQDKKRLQEQIKDLRTATWSFDGDDVVTLQDYATLRLSSLYLLDRVTVRLWRAPRILLPDTRVERSMITGSPLWEKELTLTLDKQGGAPNQEVKLPVEAVGNYYLEVVGVPNKQASDRKNLTSYSAVTRTNLVGISLSEGQKQQRQWLDARTGAPLAGESILSFLVETNARGVAKERQGASFTTDALGRHSLLINNQVNYYRLSNGSDPLTLSHWGGERADRERPGMDLATYRDGHTYLTTDRPAYRPGQMVQLYGIVWSVGYHAEMARSLADREITLELVNASGQVVSKQVTRSDEFGRFSVPFELPRTGLTGRYAIRTRGGAGSLFGSGQVSFEVFEYKRGDLALALTAPHGPYNPGQRLELTGSLQTLSGSGVAGASLEYELRRTRNFWRIWSEDDGYDESETSVGTLRTDSEGKFTLPVTLPKRSEDGDKRDDEPIVPWDRYELIVTATDALGQKRTERMNFVVGREVYRLSVKMPRLIDRATASEATFTFERPTEHRYYRRSAGSGASEAELPLVSYQIKQGQRTILEGKAKVGDKVSLLDQLRSQRSGRYELSYRLDYSDSLSYQGSEALYLIDSKRDKRIEDLRSPLVISVGDGHYSAQRKPQIHWSTSLEGSYIYYYVYSDLGSIASGVLRPKAGSLNALPVDLTSTKLLPEQITIRLYTVRDGQYIEASETLKREQPKQELSLSWDTFRDHLRAGTEETYQLRLKRPDGTPATHTALGVWLYDASLEDFGRYRSWRPQRSLGYVPGRGAYSVYSSLIGPASAVKPVWKSAEEAESLGRFVYPQVRPASWRASGMAEYAMAHDAVSQPRMMLMSTSSAEAAQPVGMMAKSIAPTAPTEQLEPLPSGLVRQAMAETAFYHGSLTTDKSGTARWSFTAPERLSQWRLVVLASDSTMRTLSASQLITTYRELSVRPSLPRFLRSGDEVQLLTEVRNDSPESQSGRFSVELFDPVTKSVLSREERSFQVATKGTETISVPLSGFSGRDSVGLRIVARGSNSSDGEQHILPVLSDRVQVTDRIAFVRTGQERDSLSLTQLLPGASAEVGAFNFSITTQAELLALTSLPTLARGEDASSLGLAMELYARHLISQLRQSPWLVRWAKDLTEGKGGKLSTGGEPADMLNTPWAGIQESEEAARLRLAQMITADTGSTEREITTLTNKLAGLESSTGGWSWYPGMPANNVMTQAVAECLLRLSDERLGSTHGLSDSHKVLSAQLQRALQWLEEAAIKDQHTLTEARRAKKRTALPYVSTNERWVRLSLQAEARKLYRPTSQGVSARRFFLSELRSKLTKLPLSEKPQAALTLLSAGDRAGAESLAETLRQYLRSDERGLYYPRLERAGYLWYDPNLPAVAETIELMQALGNKTDEERMLQLKRWIISQKRTTSWLTNYDAMQALGALLPMGLHSSPRSLGEPNEVQVTLHRATGATEALQGVEVNYQTEAKAGQPLDLPRSVDLSAPRGTVLWGSAALTSTQPLQDLKATGQQIQLERHYYLVRTTAQGEELYPLSEGAALQVGDRLRTRLVIRATQTMDFLRLTDPRPGFAEPRGQQPSYHYAGGLGYYLEPKDAETNFYIEGVVPGRYEVDYDQWVARSGRFVGGAASIASTYAPDYSARTASTGGLVVSPTKEK